MSKSHAAAVPHPAKPPSVLGRWIGNVVQWLLTVGLIALAVYWLVWGSAPGDRSPEGTKAVPGPARSVEVVGPSRISIDLQAPIGKRLTRAQVRKETLSAPLVTVTGGVIACRRPGHGEEPDFWQFQSTEMLDTYTNYEKSQAEVEFTTSQLGRIRELAQTKENALKVEIERSERLVQSGTESIQDLVAKKTSLLETRISNEKDIYDAEMAVATAHRNLMALGLQLRQSGLNPALLKTATPDMDIVAAEVPEASIDLVRVGQSCTANFFGLRNMQFHGKVNDFSSILSAERRTLRVLFILHDPEDKLRPGMFAVIGLGTDPRPALLAPADGVIHIGNSDYVLAATDQGDWRVVEVDVGDRHNAEVEIVSGLKEGDQIIGEGAVLLKPAVVRAIQSPAPVRANVSH